MIRAYVSQQRLSSATDASEIDRSTRWRASRDVPSSVQRGRSIDCGMRSRLDRGRGALGRKMGGECIMHLHRQLWAGESERVVWAACPSAAHDALPDDIVCVFAVCEFSDRPSDR